MACVRVLSGDCRARPLPTQGGPEDYMNMFAMRALQVSRLHLSGWMTTRAHMLTVLKGRVQGAMRKLAVPVGHSDVRAAEIALHGPPLGVLLLVLVCRRHVSRGLTGLGSAGLSSLCFDFLVLVPGSCA